MSFANLNGGVKAEGKRSENDYYPTPPFVTFALIEHAKRRGLEVPQCIHEPAAGRGWMMWELRRLLKNVVGTDLIAHPDLLYTDIVGNSDYLLAEENVVPIESAMITNPPFTKDMAQKFVEKGLKRHPYVAILARTMFVESAKRYEFFKMFPPSEIMNFSSRFSCEEKYFFTNPLSGMVGYSWFVWDYRNGKPKETLTSWINTKEMHTLWRNSLTEKEFSVIQAHVIQPDKRDEQAASLESFLTMGAVS